MDSLVTEPDAILLQDSYDLDRLAESMLHTHYARLHFLAYSILGDADEADEAVQEALIRALANIDRYRPGSNMKAWLSSITVRKCQDLLRQRKVRQRLSQGLQWLVSNKQRPNPPEEKRVNEEAKSALWSLVDELSEKHRLPIILRYVHNYDVREIAQLLDIREGTVHFPPALCLPQPGTSVSYPRP